MAEHTSDSTPALIRGVMEDARELIRNEIMLARAEIREEVAGVRTVGVAFGAAVGLPGTGAYSGGNYIGENLSSGPTKSYFQALRQDKLDAWNAWAVLNVLTAGQNGTRQGAETLSQVLLSRDEHR